jgi:UDP-N-acetylmuramate dehydrogenase
VRILRDKDLTFWNSLSLPATASALLNVVDDAVLPEALAWSLEKGMPLVPMGQGSNIVLAGNVEALVVRMETRGIRLLEESEDYVELLVAAGEDWHGLVQWCLSRGYYGLENLALIPGTVGAASVQNIGAYGVELKTFLMAVHGIDNTTGETLILTAEDCEFGYRDSIFKNALRDKVVITAITLKLPRRPQVESAYPALAQYLSENGLGSNSPQDVFDAVVAIRSARLPNPAELPNAGSFFKNPTVSEGRARDLAASYPELPMYQQEHGGVKLPAAWLIEHCGWKGVRRGGCGVHPRHALVLINYGGCDGLQLLELAADIRQSVHDTFALELEIEPRIYGAARERV